MNGIASAEPGKSATAAYATGSFATGVFSTVPSILLLYFCTEFVHIPAAYAAVVVFIPKAWSIIWDPSVGGWSDRASTRIGRRRPFMIVGAIGVAFAFAAVFRPPFIGMPWGFAWVAVTYFLLTTFYSAFAVPYVALPAEIGATPDSRSRIVGWRMVAAMLGVLAGAGIAPLLVQQGGGGLPGYGFMAVCIAVVCALTMSAPILMLGRRDAANAQGPAEPWRWARLVTPLRRGRFRNLIFAYVLQLTAVGIISASAPYLVTRVLGRSESDIGIGMLFMLGATTLTVPLWSWAGRKLGEGQALFVAVLLFAVTSAIIGAVTRVNAEWPLVLCALFAGGIPFAGMQVLPYTMVAHLIHRESQLGGSAEGAFTGLWTASEKLGLALGPALTGAALSLTHNDYAGGLTLFVILAPGLLGLVSLPLLAASITPAKEMVMERA